MERAKRLLTRFEERMNLVSKAEKRWFWCTFIILVVYTEAVLLMQLINLSTIGTVTALFTAFIVIPLCFAGVYILRRATVNCSAQHVKNRKNSVFFAALVFLLTFSLMFFWQKAFFPGSFSPDSIEQYKQVLSGEFNDWHPVLHTWLFFGLPMLFSDAPAAIITFQLLWFSLSVAYLYYVLFDSGCNKIFLFFSYIYIVANPNTALIMLYPWKDSALTIFATVIFAQLIRIYISNGKWLCKWYNLVSFSVFMFLANTVRHNAILLVAPLLLILFVFLKDARKRIAFSAAILILLTFLLKVPIYSLANVESPDRRQTEMIGLPMTVLQNIYMEDRDALSEEAREFMDSLATQENWEKHHQFSNFNSMKWSDGQISYKVEQEGAGAILKYTLEGSVNSPSVALRSVISLTSMVWSIDGGDGWSVWYGISENDLGIEAEYNKAAANELIDYRHIINTYATKYLFNFIGVIILLLLFSAVAKIGGGGLAKAFAVLPLICYNFGTMLLLTGHDFRFFHLNFIIVVPILYILFSKDKNTVTDK